MIVDTHCHVPMIINKDESSELTQEDVTAISRVLQKARDYHVTHLVTISTTRASIHQSISIARTYDNVSAAAGVHPCDYAPDWRSDIAHLQDVVANPEHRPHIAAIGECGLDFHHPGYDAQEQTDVFKAQIEIALEHDLPIVVHSRKATHEALNVIEPYIQDGLRGVIHCYAGDADLAHDICNRFGFYVGIAGPVTYPKNDRLREAVDTVGLSNILLETDAPFLPPQQIRGKRNHPLYTQNVAQEVASILDLDMSDVASQTTANAQDMFGIEV